MKLNSHFQLSFYSNKKGQETTEEAELVKVRQCLKWITFNQIDDGLDYTLRFSRLSTVFLSASDLFLDHEIQKLISYNFESINPLKLDLDSDIPGLGNFYNFYGELLLQFGAVSYGNSLFSRFILLPTASRFNKKYRTCLWIENSDVLRNVYLKNSDINNREIYLNPAETDIDLNQAYVTALINSTITKSRNEFLFDFALHQSKNYIKQNPDIKSQFNIKDETLRDLLFN